MHRQSHSTQDPPTSRSSLSRSSSTLSDDDSGKIVQTRRGPRDAALLAALGRHGSKNMLEEPWPQFSSPPMGKEPSIRATKQSSVLFASEYVILRRLRYIAKSEWFEGLFGILIVLNALVMSVETQYWGEDTGFELGYPGMSKPASEAWPHAAVIFKILDVCFGLAFVLEVMVKLLGFRTDFFWSYWNWLDFLIIAMWLANNVFAGMLPVDPLTLRIARLAKIIRIVRLVRTIQIFDILHLMAASLSASLSALLWSVLLLFGIMMSAAMVMVGAIEFYIANEGNPLDTRMKAYDYFGTFTKAFFSVFEITLGNFAPITRFLSDNISEFYHMLFMMYYCVVSFAILMVIRGIFLHETFQAADANDNLMILRQLRTRTKILKKLQRLFFEANVSDDGFLSYEEFTLLMEDDRVQTWLAAMGLEIRDADIIFEMVDSGENRVDVQNFVSGLARLKGQARAVDLVQVLRYSRSIMDLLVDVKGQLGSTDFKRLLRSNNERIPEPTSDETDFSAFSTREDFGSNPTLLVAQREGRCDKNDANLNSIEHVAI